MSWDSKYQTQSNTRKRLFADLDSDVHAEGAQRSGATDKKARLDTNFNKNDFSIASARKWDSAGQNNPTNAADDYAIEEEQSELHSKVLTRIPTGAYITCRSEFSKRVYFRVRDELSDAQLEQSLGKIGKMESLLFGVRCDASDVERREALFDAVRDATYRKLDSERQSDSRQAELNNADELDSASQSAHKLERGSNALWLDRYTPRRYLDLVSDEQVNRRVLKWLKAWDGVVRGSRQSDRTSSLASKQNASQFSATSFDDQFSRLDERGAPYWKVLVLVGTPGCGKTTLAHVAARHAGYLPIEVNASDDRSTTVFRERLEAALEFRAALCTDSDASSHPFPATRTAVPSRLDESHPASKSSPLPLCLILDEIDGAPPASVRLLVDRIKADSVTKASRPGAVSESDSDLSDSGDGEKQKKRKRNAQTDDAADTEDAKQNARATSGKRKRSKPIRRPIIAICNDLYATSLRALRRVALVVRCGVPDTRALVDRLAQIAISERVLLADAAKPDPHLTSRAPEHADFDANMDADSEEESNMAVAPRTSYVDRSVLEKVARMHNYDIRSSLNALQFVIATAKHSHTDDGLPGSNAAQKSGVDELLSKLSCLSHKDAQEAASNNLFQVGNVLFNLAVGGVPQTKPKPGTRAGDNQQDGIPRTFGSLFYYFDAALFGGRDQLERLLFLAFENYALIPLRDTFMQKVSQMADALCFNERISTFVSGSQCYALQAYHAITFVFIAFLYTANRATRFAVLPSSRKTAAYDSRNRSGQTTGAGAPFAKPAPAGQANPFGRQPVLNTFKGKQAQYTKPSGINSATDNRQQTGTAASTASSTADTQSKSAAGPTDRVRYPTEWYEFRSTLERNRSLLSDWHAEFYRTLPTKDLRSRQFRCIANDATDFLPFLVRLIQPKIRPINVQLFTAAEKRELSRVIDAMLTYNLEYRQVLESDAKPSAFGQTANGRFRHSLNADNETDRFDANEARPEILPSSSVNKYTYVLEPDLESLVKFAPTASTKSANPFVQSGGRQLTYTAKQVIAREMEVERLRKHEAVELENGTSKAPPVGRAEPEACSSNVKSEPFPPAENVSAPEVNATNIAIAKKPESSVLQSAPTTGKWQLPTLKSQFKPTLEGQVGDNAPPSSILRWVIPKAKADDKRNADSKH